ncbi:MAG: SRPBCC family protein [Gemmataceae bacterium]|nr:SRPBCC family protein [Gemmataceae bacterium]
MTQGLSLLSVAGLSAGLMYFFDPLLGRRRRRRVRDQAVSALARADDLISKTGRDLSQRAAGLMAEASARFRGKVDVPDEVLAERVRAKIGRVCSHPSSLAVEVRHGRVILDGPILADDVNDVLRAAASVRGVTGVDDRLEVYEEAGRVPALQGEGKRPGTQIDLMQAHWAPATRLLAGAVGCGLMANCLARRTPLAACLGTVGFGLFLRGLTNLEMKQLLGLGDGRRGIHFLKTIHLAVPVEQAFAFWSSFENFPQFMTHVREVRDLGDGRSRWTVEGPAGIPVHWDAVATQQIPNRLLAWESVPGSPVAHAGVVHFQPNSDGSTRVHIRLSYVPPAGVLGHAVAALFGADPKREMDDDLLRMKSFLETGIAPHDAAAGRPSRHQKSTHQMGGRW